MSTASFEISVYDAALIGGGFTIIGALIGALASYWLTTHLERLKEQRSAAKALRAAFAPALGAIYLARHHGSHDRPEIGAFLKENLPAHAAAIEEFKLSAQDATGLQASWEDYRHTVRLDNFTIDTLEWESGGELWSKIEQKIHAMLRYAL